MAEKATRKHFLVLPSYQMKLVGFLVILLFLWSVLHGFFLYRITAKSVQDGFLSAHNRLQSTWEILKPAIVLSNGISFLLLSLAFMTVSIFLSHRLIGPLFKIANRIKDLKEGHLNLPPVRLRQGDEGQLLIDHLNQLQQSYRERLTPLRELQKKLSTGTPPNEKEIRETIDQVLHNIDLEESSTTRS